MSGETARVRALQLAERIPAGALITCVHCGQPAPPPSSFETNWPCPTCGTNRRRGEACPSLDEIAERTAAIRELHQAAMRGERK